MMPMQNCRLARMLEPISLNGTAGTTTEVDTKADGIDWAHLTVILALGAVGATMDEVTIQESDVSGSGFVNITGLTFTDPVAGNANGFAMASIPLLGARKRYIKAVIDPGAAATLVCMIGVLHRGRGPIDATQAGCFEWLKIG